MKGTKGLILLKNQLEAKAKWVIKICRKGRICEKNEQCPFEAQFGFDKKLGVDCLNLDRDTFDFIKIEEDFLSHLNIEQPMMEKPQVGWPEIE